MEYTSDNYPSDCTVSTEDLQKLKEIYEDPDREFGEKLDTDWPPRDVHGNVYPIWFTPDDLSPKRDKLYDSNYTRYSPFAGNLSPHTRDDCGVCNAPLNNWRQRYENIRFCGQITYDGQTFCKTHKNRIDPSGKTTMKDEVLDDVGTAEEKMQTGFWTRSVDHFYSNLDPHKKLFGWGTFESLMGESTYEFGVEYEVRKIDFSDAVVKPDDLDEDGYLTVRFGYPTQNTDPALSLYVAAMMGVQMITVQPRIMFEDEDEGERMMESKTIETAQLTAPPSEHDPSPQEFKTLETWSEHHLNLPLSRLVTDRPKLLERGGVGVDADDKNETMAGDDLVLEIQADHEGTETGDGGTDPNAFEDYKSESERIVEHTSQSEATGVDE